MTATQDIPISLTLPKSDHRATALKAVVFCRGSALGLVSVPSLANVPSKRMDVDLVPLRSISLTGRVSLPKDETASDLRLDMYFEHPISLMSYFEEKEAHGSGIKVSTTTLAADGSFTTTVPDFVNDPFASKYPGRFHLNIRGPARYGCARIPGQPEFGPDTGIAMAPSYPRPIALELRWP